MNFTTKERIAFKEVNDIINIIGKEYEDKIPKKLLELLKNEEEKEYKTNIKTDLDFKHQNISRTALILLNYINRKYWIDSEEKKKIIKEEYAQNEERHIRTLSEKYDINEIFKKRGNK